MDAAALRRLVEERIALHLADMGRAHRGTSRNRPHWLTVLSARMGECKAILAAMDDMEARPLPPEPGAA